MYQSAQGLTTSCEHFLTRHIIVLPMISVAVDSLDAIVQTVLVLYALKNCTLKFVLQL